MTWILNKYTIGAGALLFALVAVWWYGHVRYKAGVSDTQVAAKLEAYAQYVTDMSRINAANADLRKTITELRNANPTIITKYRDRVVEAPLSADCHIDGIRLLSIQSAIEAARAAGKPSSTLPRNP